MSNSELASFFSACGYKPYLVEGDEPFIMHDIMSKTLDLILKDIKEIKESGDSLLKYPMIILRTPKGWTGPKEVDGNKIEGSFRAHQVPISMEKEEHLPLLEKWLRSYKPEELFDENGRLRKDLKELAPKGRSRMGSNPHANGGLLLEELRTPDFRKYGVKLERKMGTAISAVLKGNVISSTYDERLHNWKELADIYYQLALFKKEYASAKFKIEYLIDKNA